MKKKIYIGALIVSVLLGIEIFILDDHQNGAGQEPTLPVGTTGTKSENSAQMADGTPEARKTVNQFVQRLRHPQPGDSHFGVKMMLRYQSETEYVWLTQLVYEEGVFVGLIATEPDRVTHVRKGEIVQVHKSDIVDWMWKSNGKTFGGFTLRKP